MIGQEIRDRVFRDTKDYYIQSHEICLPLVEFAKKFAGKKILDLGCAAGNYCLELSKNGFEMKGADINPAYVKRAQEAGVDAHALEALPSFGDKSFDSVLLFEVLEHLADPARTLTEAKRLAKKNVLITVPNCEKIEELQHYGLIPEHFSDLDHKNFFTPETLETLLKAHFNKTEVWKGDPINPVALMGNPLTRLAGKVIKRLGVMPPRFYFRLYAVASID
ncbi:MAG: hypothetical protein A2901_05490 [Elusimicrobia bacterium RIFCSPLOWO2_01_FULL_54_10]|nr:MAG: hypothetical protein A2901_05490 [Elusimicrobia bacterium RIFCSPLOWO2_01_FULL_54_10]